MAEDEQTITRQATGLIDSFKDATPIFYVMVCVLVIGGLMAGAGWIWHQSQKEDYALRMARMELERHRHDRQTELISELFVILRECTGQTELELADRVGLDNDWMVMQE